MITEILFIKMFFIKKSIFNFYQKLYKSKTKQKSELIETITDSLHDFQCFKDFYKNFR